MYELLACWLLGPVDFEDIALPSGWADPFAVEVAMFQSAALADSHVQLQDCSCPLKRAPTKRRKEGWVTAESIRQLLKAPGLPRVAMEEEEEVVSERRDQRWRILNFKTTERELGALDSDRP